MLFFFNDTATTEIYTLSLHDALPISLHGEIKLPGMANHFYRERVDQHLRIGMRAIDILREGGTQRLHSRSEEHTSELQSQSNLVCRLLLEKKKKKKKRDSQIRNDQQD